MKAVIIAGGSPPNIKLLKKEITPQCIIICADSGANLLFDLKILPHYIIGDLDSISPRALTYFKKNQVIFEKYPQNKNSTDAVLAVQKAHKMGITELVFLGCLGGKRIDHLFGAIGLLQLAYRYNIKATLIDRHNTITLIKKNTTISGKSGQKFSLLAYCNVVKNLSIKGSKFNLRNYNLKIGDTRTISNEFLKKPAIITFDSGQLLLFTET